MRAILLKWTRRKRFVCHIVMESRSTAGPPRAMAAFYRCQDREAGAVSGKQHLRSSCNSFSNSTSSSNSSSSSSSCSSSSISKSRSTSRPVGGGVRLEFATFLCVAATRIGDDFRRRGAGRGAGRMEAAVSVLRAAEVVGLRAPATAVRDLAPVLAAEVRRRGADPNVEHVQELREVAALCARAFRNDESTSDACMELSLALLSQARAVRVAEELTNLELATLMAHVGWLLRSSDNRRRSFLREPSSRLGRNAIPHGTTVRYDAAAIAAAEVSSLFAREWRRRRPCLAINSAVAVHHRGGVDEGSTADVVMTAVDATPDSDGRRGGASRGRRYHSRLRETLEQKKTICADGPSPSPVLSDMLIGCRALTLFGECEANVAASSAAATASAWDRGLIPVFDKAMACSSAHLTTSTWRRYNLCDLIRRAINSALEASSLSREARIEVRNWLREQRRSPSIRRDGSCA
eukprot:TRINITY_DN9664_c0_g1_i2.p1 TRINITY_DN9664_c0_g1~~TRINITY_DN9664_c0_g1_i2.p1  ORF type:complete len:464 (+),score=76.88 TRINITY_DN9664_c0_g1_i2:672-2063(+)